MFESSLAEGYIDGVGGTLDNEAGPVAQIGRACDRQHQVRPFAYAPGCQRASEVGAAVGQAVLPGDIDEAGETEHRVENEALGGIPGPLPFALGDVIDECERKRQVPNHIVGAAPDRAGHHRSIDEGGRAENDRVEQVVDGEDQPVQRLERIVVGHLLRLPAGARRQGRGGGKQACQKQRTGRQTQPPPGSRRAGGAGPALEPCLHLRFYTFRAYPHG